MQIHKLPVFSLFLLLSFPFGVCLSQSSAPNTNMVSQSANTTSSDGKTPCETDEESEECQEWEKIFIDSGLSSFLNTIDIALEETNNSTGCEQHTCKVFHRRFFKRIPDNMSIEIFDNTNTISAYSRPVKFLGIFNFGNRVKYMRGYSLARAERMEITTEEGLISTIEK